MNRLWRLVIVVALLPLACARAQDTSKNDETITAYMQLFDSAQGSKDPEYVKSVIKTMREKYMNTTPKILGIYYNMALLYRRIGLYDDAVKVMKEDKGPSGGFYLATLFIRIGRAEDARVILQGFQTDLRTRLANDKLEINARSSIVETLLVRFFADEDQKLRGRRVSQQLSSLH